MGCPLMCRLHAPRSPIRRWLCRWIAAILLVTFMSIFLLLHSMPKMVQYSSKEAMNLLPSAALRELYSSIRLAPNKPATTFNCSAIFDGDQEEIALAKLRMRSEPFKRDDDSTLTEAEYTSATAHCETFKRDRRYFFAPLSLEERDFPIAFSIVVHTRVDMFERLLRSIYMPQNVYCIHVDEKSPDDFFHAVEGIANCFDNVFLASKREAVVYASWYRIQADLNCMKELLHRPDPWRYILNLCGQDFPIKTNFEIVQQLKALAGKNSLESESVSEAKKNRFAFSYKVVGTQIVKTDVSKSPAPFASGVFSGSAYFILSRAFVQHILGNEVARIAMDWFRDTYSPDEFLWATLQRMPGIPGSDPPNSKYHVSDMKAVARLVKWHYLEGDIQKGAPYPPCQGEHRRSVCVYGAGDLHWIIQNHHLFANKFDTKVDPVAVQCLEEYLRHRAFYQLR
uniref:beta-1,3-galactosyl-O-glycosyl-glycoprotein beta-1,6-N-acetylglucosaminyltransferase-like n=1 Tax=Myxine glutinosa TaxID=7769 RepID=UPI00358FC2A5